ncbi:conserved hypothetical protein [uncultured Pleomorphomonas sp.]|uniref:Uncharacterized protein n=2 Tax=uncultured Pleomorphomonas sp. TaxID=442121 RepID=A0A212LPG0_9HYPH|nr:conserved hypothetical protein [uncultured Pleomorphomonas sp.]
MGLRGRLRERGGMTNPASFHHATCGLCGRRADGIGFSPGGRPPVVWVCNDCGLARARTAARMRDFDAVERRAFALAARRAGQFLDTIGKTDLAVLTTEEYEGFLRAFQTHFVEEIRRLVEGEATP